MREMWYEYFVVMNKRQMMQFSKKENERQYSSKEFIENKNNLRAVIASNCVYACSSEDDYPFFELLMTYLDHANAFVVSEKYNCEAFTSWDEKIECHRIGDRKTALNYLHKREQQKLTLDNIYAFLCSIAWNDDLDTANDIMGGLQMLDMVMRYVVKQDVAFIMFDTVEPIICETSLRFLRKGDKWPYGFERES
jgi:hypothetical protein